MIESKFKMTSEEIKNSIGETVYEVWENGDAEFDLAFCTILGYDDLTNEEVRKDGVCDDVVHYLSHDNFKCSMPVRDVVLCRTVEQARDFIQEQINNIVAEDNPCDSVSIYSGGFITGLVLIDKEEFEWHVEDAETPYEVKHLTLSEIRQQAVDKGLIEPNGMLTVFQETPLKGYIYQSGNYNPHHNWVLHGTTKGYA